MRKTNRNLILAVMAVVALSTSACIKIEVPAAGQAGAEASSAVDAAKEAVESADSVVESAVEQAAAAVENAAEQADAALESAADQAEATLESAADQVTELVNGTSAAADTSAESRFNGLESKVERNEYEAEGTAVIKAGGDELLLTRLQLEQDKEILVEGEVERVQGALELVYRAPDGTETVILGRAAENTRREQEFLTEFSAKAGMGELFFRGDASEYHFELEFKNWPNA